MERGNQGEDYSHQKSQKSNSTSPPSPQCQPSSYNLWARENQFLAAQIYIYGGLHKNLNYKVYFNREVTTKIFILNLSPLWKIAYSDSKVIIRKLNLNAKEISRTLINEFNSRFFPHPDNKGNNVSPTEISAPLRSNYTFPLSLPISRHRVRETTSPAIQCNPNQQKMCSQSLSTKAQWDNGKPPNSVTTIQIISSSGW